MIASYLLFCGKFKDSQEALEYFGLDPQPQRGALCLSFLASADVPSCRKALCKLRNSATSDISKILLKLRRIPVLNLI